MKTYIKKGMSLTDGTGISIPVCEQNRDYIQVCKDASNGQAEILEWIELDLPEDVPFKNKCELLRCLWKCRKGMSNEAIKAFNYSILGV